ncbi:MAG TPA: helix-turn-helix domain-containing protein [Stellaceae bacterium]|jgi:chromosomal replication initiator protein|nr:helix-turn-helix domain-containing protein [Stellaceae bacterium]
MTLHIAEIQYAVAQRFGLPMIEMKSDRRARRFARPRQVAMYLASEMTPHSFPAIGKHFGNRDHTTVMHACRVIAEKMGCDRELQRTVAEVRWLLERDPNQGVLPLHERCGSDRP